MSVSLQPNNSMKIPVPDEVTEYDEVEIEHIVLETVHVEEGVRNAA
jgi:hypothetical protein